MTFSNYRPPKKRLSAANRDVVPFRSVIEASICAGHNGGTIVAVVSPPRENGKQKWNPMPING
jgi:hypothetical protein